MPEQKSLTLTLNEENSDFVRRKLSSGEFSSESELVETAVQMMIDREAEKALHEREDSASSAEFEKWLHEVAGPIYDRLKADPSRAIPSEEVDRRLEERRRLRKKIA